MIKSVKKTISNTLDFQGRSKRSEYWLYFLFIFIFIMIAATVDGFFGLTEDDPSSSPIYMTVGVVLQIPCISLTVRRAHDIGWSGWVALPIFALGFVGMFTDAMGVANLAGLVLSLAVGLMPGNQGQNRYGALPSY